MVCDTATTREKNQKRTYPDNNYFTKQDRRPGRARDVKFETVTNTRFDPDEIDTCDFQFPCDSKAFNAISVVQFF